MNEICDIVAEKWVLSSVFFNKEAYYIVKAILRSDDFSLAEHRMIWDVIEALAPTASVIDFAIVRDALVRRGQLDAVGGISVIVSLMDFAPTHANAEHYATIVKDNSIRRSMASVASSILCRCAKPDDAPAEQIRVEAIKDFNDCADKLTSAMQTMEDVFSDIKFDKEDLGYTATGYHDIDKHIAGLGNGQMIIIAGRPGSGKSSLMMGMALNLAKKKKKVSVYSLEMSAKDIGIRMACSMAGVNLGSVVKGLLDATALEKLEAAKWALHALPITFDCKSLTVSRMVSSLMSSVRQGKCDIAFIDYLGLIKSDNKKKSKYEDVSDISNALKQLAMDTNIPIIVGCQLNRANESRSDKHPQMSDLRDSGAIEQDADIVMLLHRDKSEEGDFSGVVDCGIEKNRRGPTSRVQLGFSPEYTRFYNLAKI